MITTHGLAANVSMACTKRGGVLGRNWSNWAPETRTFASLYGWFVVVQGVFAGFEFVLFEPTLVVLAAQHIAFECRSHVGAADGKWCRTFQVKAVFALRVVVVGQVQRALGAHARTDGSALMREESNTTGVLRGASKSQAAIAARQSR